MTRRRMMGGSVPQEDVRFWMSGEDAPIMIDSVGYWYERVKNTPFGIYGDNTYDSANKEYDFSITGRARYDANTYDFGHHWKLLFDMDAYIYKGRTVDRYFLDLGSVSNAQHAIGFAIGIATGGRTTIGVNWKLNGNGSNPGIGALAHSYTPLNNVSELEPVKGYYAIVDGGDGYDRLEVNINGIVERYDVKIPQVSYSPPWNLARIMVGADVNNAGYKCPSKIRELKMVVID